MMRMKKNFLLIMVALVIVPQVAFASWWNPFTWKIFQRSAVVKIEKTTTPPSVSTTTAEAEQPKIDKQAAEIENLKKEVEDLKKKSNPIVATPKPQLPPAPNLVKTVQSPVPPKIAGVVTPEARNFKQPVLESINTQINSYKAISTWIDGDMLPLLSQRESMLNELISNSSLLMSAETDPSAKYVYELFIEAYNLDKTQIVVFYRGIFSDIKSHINNEKISALNNEYGKFSAKTLVSEAEYNTEIQVLSEYQNYWQKLYDGGVKLAMTQYMSQTNAKDEMYQRLWANWTPVVSDLNRIQVLQSGLNQLYMQQPKPLNCTFSSHYNGYGTTGTVKCN